MSRHVGERKKLSVIKWGAKDALMCTKKGYKVIPLTTGSAEIWNEENECVGFMERRSLAKFVREVKTER